MNNTTNLSSLIWSSADDVLRGLFKPSEYGRVILPFVVMRRLDCVLEPKKDEVYKLHKKYKNKLDDTSPVICRQVGLPFLNTSKFDLSRIKSDPTNVLMNFNNYVQGYSNNVLDIIENFSINPLVEKLHKNNRLYLLIDKFTEFDLHPNKIDNHQMGSVYEELLRKFSEMSNEESGDHFTPRDVVKLLVSFVFGGDKEALQGEGKIRSVFDPCCGTGGMLTIGKEWIHENINSDLKIDLYGQELNDVTYSICKSDLLMMDENPDNIQGPTSSISDDRYQGRKFDYMITNPPFGVSWKSEKEFVDEEAKDPNGRFFVGTPRSSDGSLLFLQHLIHKMNPEGSRIGIVFNGSPLFTGDAGSGESDIRKWIIENDWLECIVSLPDRMFFNTGIQTYIWIVTNKKSSDRKGKVQMIDGTSFFKSMKKNLGDKGKYINDDQTDTLFEIYQNNEENAFCKIFPNHFFGYTKVIVEQALIEDGKLKTDRQGNAKPDTSKRDNERVRLSENIEEYFEREVKPHLPDSWMDRSKDKVGYEINFTKYFYKFTPLRSLEDISKDLKSLDDEIKQLSLINQCVTKGLDPNVEMKDSGVEWIGEIPKHWDRVRVKHLVSAKVTDGPHETPEFVDQGIPFLSVEGVVGNKIDFNKVRGYITQETHEVYSRKCKPKKFDVLLVKSGSTTGKSTIVETDIDFNIWSPLCVLRSNLNKIDPYFMFNSIQSGYFRTQVETGWSYGTQPNIGMGVIENLWIAFPHLDEQEKINRFLTHRIHAFDTQIENYEKQIELLKEYRQSLISSTVTGKVRVTEDMV